ncbi:50S ribosomal protein L4 [Candidatus Shapirobacteria bacterium CG03_land_8_20_14_0_80_40_19]|uniref:Large ribosomal subunit protein uL4 n=4 Tax=Candidatus Shapironibacteriota TaxID=1752721 RepID=A0A2M7BE07_9BACT|nr:MAG: 50S ribosomal protein L4 [Candidatus Shapirobacteria bacterium CG11_big_fil_rev_8_21_14_0_20_40_12]PIV01316.1 MAG: 50S ribosomal protein L4 [Candidatus Shapirobacteria bacterium CG03_land_8_20_14_0_80_40_19]PJC29192.1 MAG: 50S ribosomal protein L4 [Candidatus Shapirobacteria bacterium CG_4_9_14_0_2_um_filter_40_11]PJC76651.1 MAG: 50S ribosomal protein L4 [Candidatus Shapirobacteria bacterium CG_4_8_14_3_um_filter_39_11]
MKSVKLVSINQQAEKAGEKTVGVDFFGIRSNPVLVSQSVRKFLSNQRKGYGKAKTRGQVNGSGVKIWNQKGTGRARHGDRQAPIFVGGGKAHGPTGRQKYSLRLNQKMNQKAIYSVLSSKLEEKNLYLLENFKITKTKEASSFLEKARKNLKLEGKVMILHGPKEEIVKYFRNLVRTEVLNAANINVYRLLKAGSLLITQGGLAEIVKEND